MASSTEMKIGVVAGLIYLIAVIAIIVGYVMNVIDLFSSLSSEINTLFVARIVGLFLPPIGAILGYFF